MASHEAIALRLGTSVKTIEDLENGRVAALPPWPETVRIVRAYFGLRNIDPTHMLAHIQALLQSMPLPEEVAADRAAAQGPSPKILRGAQSRAPVLVEPLPDREGGGLRRLLVMGAMPAILAVAAYLTVIAPAVGYRAIALLPASLAVPAKQGLDAIVLYAAPTHDKLKWIDIGYPRLRRADKLQTKGR
jgi:transcriptional regulator with XRE-family HTH domain